MRVRIQPYQAASRSARVLSQETGILRLRLVDTRFRPGREDLIINWGSQRRLFNDEFYLNTPTAVARASNKLRAFEAMQEADVCIPAFTTEREVAQGWVDAGGIAVVRNEVSAREGRGIGLVGREIEDGDHTGLVPEAPLYTRYVPKYDEYRVHVFQGQVLDIQQKRRRNGERDTDSRIRNSRFGWVFCRQDVNCPSVVTDEAIKAVEALGLDFGAADVGYTRNRDRATVYEVNTAPGLEGATLRAYADAVGAIAAGAD